MKPVMCALAVAALSLPALSQETRSAIFGRVVDPQKSGIPAAAVVVTNVETNVSSRLRANETGYYEARLLLPGNYQITVEAPGFKKMVQRGIVLPVSTRREVEVTLEVGAVADSITVEADARMLDTDSVSSGRALDNHDIMELPSMGNNAVLLAQLTAGIQTGGTFSYMGLHSNMGASDYQMFGNVGGNDWSLDGAPNIGQQRRMAYLPYNDTIAEFKVDTSNFDAAVGHTTGVVVSMMTKSGTNAYHGTATWQYWNARWNGTPFFQNNSYYTKLNTAILQGDMAKAEDIRRQGSQPAGHSHNYAGTVGGPIRIPKLFDGRNKLFFFFGYNGFKDLKADDPTTFNHTVPTMAQRGGDYSDLLRVTNAAQYQIYDPLSTATDASRSGHVVRQPFAGNIIPANRTINPMLGYYTNLMPEPNNPPADQSQLPINNYFAGKTPYNWDYNSVTNRIDYNATDAHRFYGRWSWEAWKEDRNDWLYETAPGLNSNGQVRKALNGAVGWTWAANSSTVVDATVSVNEYQEGSDRPVATAVLPSEVGLPEYMDAQAGGMHMIPYVSINSYTSGNTSSGFSHLPNGYPSVTHYRTVEQRMNVSRTMGTHSWRAGLDMRQYFKTGGGGGQTGGGFTFDRTYMQRTDDGYTPAAQLGLSWAAFQLGFPTSYSQAINQPLALGNNYYGFYVTDTWRVRPKLTLTLGFRVEYESGATERYNRLVAYFDPNLPLGDFATDAQNAYAAMLSNPANANNAGVKFLQQHMPASAFQVQGGTVYPGVNGAPRNAYAGKWMAMPRVGWAYQATAQTVVRGGYGMYFDTVNVLPNNFASGPFNTSTPNPGLTNDQGRTWQVGDPAAGVSILSDPFPTRQDGTRFIPAVGTAYGPLAQIASNPNVTQYNWEHARQHRWHLGVERQIGQNLTVEASYDGSYSDRISTSLAMSYVPAEFYNFTNSRNNDVASAMSATVPNPFLSANFADLKTSAPLVYNNIIASNGFFTGKTIQVQQLLRTFPHLNMSSNRLTNDPNGRAATHSLTIGVNRRFAGGFSLNFGYTRLSTREAAGGNTGYANPFDRTPYWRMSNNGRPHRVTASGIYQFPFGKGKKWFNGGIPAWALGGWELAATYQYQPGGLISWSGSTPVTLFYNGDVKNICKGPHTLDAWFDTSGFVTASGAQAASYQAASFPYYVPGCRADNSNMLNAMVMREFRFFEKASLQLRLDALNAFNHPQFSSPNVNPTSTDFGRITSQSSQINRLVEIQARVRF
jgi:hypothetical protein